MRFLKKFWFPKQYATLSAEDLFRETQHFPPWALMLAVKDSPNWERFPKNERKFYFSPERYKTYEFLFEHLPFFSCFEIGAVALAGFFVTSFLLVAIRAYRTPLFFLAWSVFLAAFASALVLTLFSPVVESRYVAPIFALNWIGSVSFLAAFFIRQNPR